MSHIVGWQERRGLSAHRAVSPNQSDQRRIRAHFTDCVRNCVKIIFDVASRLSVKIRLADLLRRMRCLIDAKLHQYNPAIQGALSRELRVRPLRQLAIVPSHGQTGEPGLNRHVVGDARAYRKEVGIHPDLDLAGESRGVSPGSVAKPPCGSLQNGHMRCRDVILLSRFLLIKQACFSSPTPRPTFEGYGRGGGGRRHAVTAACHRAAFPSPRLGDLRSTNVSRVVDTAHDDLQQLFCAVGPYFTHPKSSMISRGHGARTSMCSLRFPSRAASRFPRQDVRLTVDHPIALADDRLPDGLCQMAFPVPGGPRKSASFTRAMNVAVARSRPSSGHLLVELKSKLSRVTCGSRNLRLFPARSTVASPRRVSSSDYRQERKPMGSHRFRLGLLQTRLQHAAMPPRRSCRKERFNSIRFILVAP